MSRSVDNQKDSSTSSEDSAETSSSSCSEKIPIKPLIDRLNLYLKEDNPLQDDTEKEGENVKCETKFHFQSDEVSTHISNSIVKSVQSDVASSRTSQAVTDNAGQKADCLIENEFTSDENSKHTSKSLEKSVEGNVASSSLSQAGTDEASQKAKCLLECDFLSDESSKHPSKSLGKSVESSVASDFTSQHATGGSEDGANYAPENTFQFEENPAREGRKTLPKVTDDLCLTLKVASSVAQFVCRETGVLQEIKIPGTPTKRQRTIDDKVEIQPEAKKPKNLLELTTEREQIEKKATPPSDLSFLPNAITSCKFEKEFAKTESKEIHQNSPQTSVSKIDSPGPSKKMDATLFASKKVSGRQIKNIPRSTSTKRRFPSSDESSQEASKKLITTPEEYLIVEQYAIPTSTKVQSPTLPQAITLETFQKECAKAVSKIIKDRNYPEMSTSTSACSPSSMKGSEGHKKMLLRRSQSDLEELKLIPLFNLAFEGPSRSQSEPRSEILQSPLSPESEAYSERNPQAGSSHPKSAAEKDPQTPGSSKSVIVSPKNNLGTGSSRYQSVIVDGSAESRKDNEALFQSENRTFKGKGTFLDSLLSVRSPPREEDKLSFSFENLLETYKIIPESTRVSESAQDPESVQASKSSPTSKSARTSKSSPASKSAEVSKSAEASKSAETYTSTQASTSVQASTPAQTSKPMSSQIQVSSPKIDEPETDLSSLQARLKLADQQSEEHRNHRAKIISKRLKVIEERIRDLGRKIGDRRLYRSLGIRHSDDEEDDSNHSSKGASADFPSPSKSSKSPSSSKSGKPTRSGKADISSDERKAINLKVSENQAAREFMHALQGIEQSLKETLGGIREDLSVGSFNAPTSALTKELSNELSEAYTTVRSRIRRNLSETPNYRYLCNIMETKFNECMALFNDIMKDLENLIEDL